MARKQIETQVITENSFMGLLASKGQIPGVVGTAISPELSRTHRLFEVVGEKKQKPAFSFRIVRPASWGMNASNRTNGGAFAH